MTRYAEVRWADVCHAGCLHTEGFVVHIMVRNPLPTGSVGEIAAYRQLSRLSLWH